MISTAISYKKLSEQKLNALRKTLLSDADLAKYVKYLLRNTEYKHQKIEDLPDQALNRAYQYAYFNKQVFEEKKIHDVHILVNVIDNKIMDARLVNCITDNP